MGGSWDGNNDCWEYCFGRETQVINQLTTIVNDMGLDGVDLDYEYFYENDERFGFTKGEEAQTFLVRRITTRLHARNSSFPPQQTVRTLKLTNFFVGFLLCIAQKQVTLGLRDNLPAGSIVTHAPMVRDTFFATPPRAICTATNY